MRDEGLAQRSSCSSCSATAGAVTAGVPPPAVVTAGVVTAGVTVTAAARVVGSCHSCRNRHDRQGGVTVVVAASSRQPTPAAPA